MTSTALDAGRPSRPPGAVLGLLAAAAAIALSGCGSSSSSHPSSKTGANAVTMKQLRFSPREITVRTGTPVTWMNADDVDHNVTAVGGAKFMSRAFGRGKKYRYTPRRPGRIRYVCTLHPGMTGTIVVKR